MIQSFDYRGSPARILFAPGAIGRTAELMEALGCTRALVLSTAGRAKAGAEASTATAAAITCRGLRKCAKLTVIGVP